MPTTLAADTRVESLKTGATNDTRGAREAICIVAACQVGAAEARFEMREIHKGERTEQFC
jgi:hypothetical protein